MMKLALLCLATSVLSEPPPLLHRPPEAEFDAITIDLKVRCKKAGPLLDHLAAAHIVERPGARFKLSHLRRRHWRRHCAAGAATSAVVQAAAAAAGFQAAAAAATTAVVGGGGAQPSCQRQRQRLPGHL